MPAIDKELLELEKRFWEAIRKRDGKAAMELSAEPAVVIGPQGIGEVDRDTLAGMVRGSPQELKDYRLGDDVKVRQVSDDVAFIAYKVSEDMVVDGKRTKLEAYDSSVWVRRDGKWTCALHTESLAGDPYGRR